MIDCMDLNYAYEEAEFMANHYEGIHYIKKNPVSVTEYYSVDVENLIQINLQNFIPKSIDSLFSTTSYFYFEKVKRLHEYWIDMANAVGGYIHNEKEKAYRIINNNLMDIVFLRIQKEGRKYTTFIYKSLISLMFFELLHDLENDIIPEVCPKCNKNFTIVRNNDIPICKTCLDAKG